MLHSTTTMYQDSRSPQDRSDTELELEIRAFIIDRQAQGMSPGTISFYTDKLGILRRYLQGRGIHDCCSVSPATMRAYVADMSETHNPGGTLQLYRSAATFFRWLTQESVIEANPMANMRRPRVPERQIEPVSVETVRAIFATCGRDLMGRRDRAILLSLLDTGCRVSEFVALDVGDVDMATGSVMVRRGKGGKSRTVFIGAKSRRELSRYLGKRGRCVPDAPLWIARSGDRLSINALQQMLIRRARVAKVEAPSPHDFRRAFALMSLRAGMDVYSLQRLMGHADLTVLRRYLAQTKEDLARAHERAGPVDRLL